LRAGLMRDEVRQEVRDGTDAGRIRGSTPRDTRADRLTQLKEIQD